MTLRFLTSAISCVSSRLMFMSVLKMSEQKCVFFLLQAGYYNAAAGCITCDCAHTGNISCHLETGHCYCPPGVTGARCTECAVGFYDFTPHGCRRQCHHLQSNTTYARTITHAQRVTHATTIIKIVKSLHRVLKFSLHFSFASFCFI